MPRLLHYQITSLGDSALLVDFGNEIDEHLNDKVQALFKDLIEDPVNFMIEAVPAFSALAVYYNVSKIKSALGNNHIAFDYMKQMVNERIQRLKTSDAVKGELKRIPVCYDFRLGPDMKYVSEHTSLDVNEIIDIHISKTYRVYMLGFLPGFPYMGSIDAKLFTPRKSTPVNVIAGSVGIVGKQTGIYPLNSPGGWPIIGRTPQKIFIPESSPHVLLKSGDMVQFYSISYDEFESYQGRDT